MPFDLDRVVEFARAAAGDPRLISAHEVQGGESHRIFRVDADDPPAPQVLVRINAIDSHRARDKAATEARTLQLLGGHGAPELLGFDGEGETFGEPAMCLSWITAEDRGLNARSHAQLAALGTLLRSLHERESAELDWERRPDAGAYLSQRVHEDVGRKLPPPEGSIPVELAHRVWCVHALALAGAIAGLASGVFDSVSASSLLHGDLSGGNVLWSNTDAWLVDWEDARLGDPAEDLAYLFFENQLDSREREAIFYGYGQCRDIERRVGVWEAVVAAGSIAWWLDRYVKASRAHSDLPSAPDYYLSAARERVVWLGA